MREPKLSRPLIRTPRQNPSLVVIVAEITPRQRSEILKILKNEEEKPKQ